VAYEVVDNFLEEEDFKNIENIMLGADFPWYYNNYVTKEEDIHNLHDYQLTHTFFNNSQINSGFFEILQPVFDKINPMAIIRVKANLLPNTNKIIEHGWHTDLPNIKCKTAVLYLNTNNGYTVFRKSEEKINSVSNRFVSFDSDMEHSGSTCTDTKVRAVINFNYL